MSILTDAKWIGAPKDYGTVCPVFRRMFYVKGKVKSAYLEITSLGCYIAHINEKRVGKFVLAPGWTSYDKRLQVQKYDVTDLIKKEENVIEITVGEGWHLGRLTWFSKRVYTAKQPAVLCELVILYDDGSQEKIVSDENFYVAQSQILFSSIYDGELFDARQKEFEWEKCAVIDYTKDTLIAQEGEEIVEAERLKPKFVTKSQTGFYILDFGQNMTGYVEFTCDAPRGTVIELCHAEILDYWGDLYTENLRSAKQRIQYISDGTRRTYKPHFTFQGFRYVRVANWPGELNPDDFTAIVVHSDMRRTGYFKCSNSKVNRLFENIIWGQKGNFLDVPTDCPQRDERLGWTGDAQVFIKTATYNFDVEKFFAKWLNDLRSEQLPDGGIPAVIPDVLEGRSNSSAAWGDAAVICPWQIYLAYGSREILERQYESMRRWVEYIRKQGDNEFLWNTGRHYGDWLALDAPYGTKKGATSEALIATAYYAYSTSLLIKAGKVLGRDVTEYEKLYENIRKAYQNEFIKDGRLICETQTAYVLTIYFELADNLDELGNILNKMIIDNGYKLKTGFVGTPYLLLALSKTGHHDTAYSLLLQEEFPSWLYSVNQGATTIWEHWDGINEEKKLWDPEMNSFNHYAYGSVGQWMYEVMAGIRIDERKPGFKNIIFEPVADRRISFVEAEVHSRHGKVYSRWELDGDKVRYKFIVPEGCTGHIVLPDGTYDVQEGTYEF